MAAFSSYQQQPAFLHDTTFLPNEFIPNFQQFYSSFDNYQEGSSFEGSAHESSCVEQQSIHNETSMIEKQRNVSLLMDNDKAQSVDQQATQDCVTNDKKRKPRNGSSLNSANSKDVKQVKAKKQKGAKGAMNDEKKDKNDKTKANEEPPKDYIHVRARRGEATDSHSLAERVRREKISVKMRTLQAIVPGCDKVTGKALMLDEIINYVQSLQNQVEILSMKLASLDPMVYTFGLMDMDPIVFGAQLQGTNNDMGLPITLMQSRGDNASGSSSPTQTFPTASSCLTSPATSSTLSPAFPNPHVNGSTNLLQHDQNPSFFHLQDGGSSYWGVNEQERQIIINQFGLNGNNSYSLH